MWSALGRFLGALFKALIPELINEWRKPEEALTVGDDATKQSVQESIRSEISEPFREEGATLAHVRDVSGVEGGSMLDLVMEGAIGGKTNRLIFVKEKLPQLPKGAEVWILDKHVVYRHPWLNVEVAAHRTDALED